MIYDNGASVEGKGLEFAIKRLKRQLSYHYKKYGREGGILLMDFHNYFNSIDHDILYEKVSKKIKDEKCRRLIHELIYCFDSGLGLGSESCQVLAVFYPNGMDHKIQNNPNITAVGRFMDDFYVISPSLEYLYLLEKNLDEMAAILNLRINHERTKIIPLTKKFEFLKKDFKLTESGKVLIQISKSNINMRLRDFELQKELLDNEIVDINFIRESYMSWRGMAKKYKSYKQIGEMDIKFLETFREKF